MNRFLITISAVLITLSGFSVTATKEYVDRQDAETLQAAKDYADQHGGGGGGGIDTNAVRDIAREEITPATNRLNQTLSDALDGKRDKVDLAVYSVTRTENTNWTWTSENKELEAALNDAGTKVEYEVRSWFATGTPEGWQMYDPDISHGPESTSVTITFWPNGVPEEPPFIPATATRPRYMDESIGPAKPNQQLAAVATDDAAKPADGSLMKYDAANDRFVKATAGTDYADEAKGTNRQVVRGSVFDGTKWNISVASSEYAREAEHAREAGLVMWSFVEAKPTTLSGYGITDGATTEEVDEAKATANEAKATANEANAYSVATYNFMNGNTNAWFAGTNYVFGADATNKHHFAFEDGMDLPSMPCSMALCENRDGIRQNVWDQRDWVSWYWSFKAGQMRREIAATNAEIRAAMTNYAPRAWSKMTAATGLENPDRSTTWIDTKNVTLSPGMAWETVATVDGCGYWTIVGNGAVIGGSGTNAVLTIRDFEGNDIMTVTKGEHRLAWLESSDFTGQSMDANNWVCFDMRADVQPTGYYSTTLEMADFVPETDAGCPAQYRWENMGGGVWRVHFLLKQGIVSASCFAKFQVEVEGQTIIRYNAGQEISGGLIYNGVKIAPDISGHPAVGTVIQWKVVNR